MWATTATHGTTRTQSCEYSIPKVHVRVVVLTASNTHLLPEFNLYKVNVGQLNKHETTRGGGEWGRRTRWVHYLLVALAWRVVYCC